MARIHNQAILERNVTKCDTLIQNILEKKEEMQQKKTNLFPDVQEKLLDFIFGRTDENPYEEISQEYEGILDGYIQTCQSMTQEVLSSRNL